MAAPNSPNRVSMVSNHMWKLVEVLSYDNSMLYRCAVCQSELRLEPDHSSDICEDEAKQGVARACRPRIEPESEVLADSPGAAPENMARDELVVAKLRRNPLNKEFKPVELLRAVAAEIEAGTFEVDGLVVIAKHTPLNGPHRHCTFTSRMGVAEISLCLDLAKTRIQKDYVVD